MIDIDTALLLLMRSQSYVTQFQLKIRSPTESLRAMTEVLEATGVMKQVYYDSEGVGTAQNLLDY